MKNTVALYCLQSTSMNVLIPKRRGEGYCKSVFGYHSSNKNCDLFEDIKPPWFIGDTCDIDGYLQIETKVSSWEKNYNKGVELTIKALHKVFPFVTEFKELTPDEFFPTIK